MNAGFGDSGESAAKKVFGDEQVTVPEGLQD